MFSNLRLNSQFYILHKEATPYIEVGQVSNVTAPMPQVGQIGQPVFYTVDVLVKVGEQTINFQKLPANADYADFAGNGKMFVSCTKEGLNDEVKAMKQRSVDILASVDYHQGVITTCDSMLRQLNPEVAEKEAQQAELLQLKSQLADMSQNLTALMEANKQLMSQLKDKASSKASKD